MAIQPFNNQQLVLLPIKLLTLPRFSVMNGHFEASVVLVKAGRKFLHLSSLYLYVVLSKDDVVIVIWSKGFHSCRLADVFSLSHLGPWIPNKVHGWTCGTEEGKLPMSWRGICAHPLIWWKHCVISNMSSHRNHGLWTNKVIMYCQVCIRYFFCMVCRSLHVTSLA